MIDKDILFKRIEKAEEYLCILKEIRSDLSFDEFKKNLIIQGSIERYLHLTIEALLDIGNHIIASENLGKVEVYSDVPRILFDSDYIKEDERELFIKIIGFRNILIHDYLNLDKDIVYKVLIGNLKDLEDILKSFGQLL